MQPKFDNGPQLREIVFRAWADKEFRARLFNAPKEVFEEFGVKVAAGVQRVIVHSNTETELHFVLPEAPDTDGLTDEELKEVLERTLGPQFVFPSVLTC